jgi:hypothetical protein
MGAKDGQICKYFRPDDEARNWEKQVKECLQILRATGQDTKQVVCKDKYLVRIKLL